MNWMKFCFFSLFLVLSFFLFQVHIEAEGIKSVYDGINDSGTQNVPFDRLPTDQETTAADEENSFSIVSFMVRVTLSLLLIVVMIFLLKKFLQFRQQQLGEKQWIRILGGLPLGSNKSLQLVQMGNKLYLLGVADSITLIKVIEDEEEKTEMFTLLKNQTGASKNMLPSFLIEKMSFLPLKNNNRGKGKPIKSSNFQKQLNDRLEEVRKKRPTIEELILKDQNHQREDESS
ncbi:flagellar biosynthetic protein FliO [Microaerobacter geothermalis]|uniref:flagellar biosynthetic protein FliO n=1 Tax=Microaerobacter geothermalis TaxID=674972 RepID=UPI001F1E0DB2|nr:flagellar biosynthetic protein FliO [Microaerobacter geothermalis]